MTNTLYYTTFVRDFLSEVPALIPYAEPQRRNWEIDGQPQPDLFIGYVINPYLNAAIKTMNHFTVVRTMCAVFEDMANSPEPELRALLTDKILKTFSVDWATFEILKHRFMCPETLKLCDNLKCNEEELK